MSKSLGKLGIGVRPATPSFSCLAVFLLVLAACSARAPNGPDLNPLGEVLPENAQEPAARSLQPGEYATEKGWGRLQVIRQGADLLFSLDTVTGEDSCALSGEVKDGLGIAKEDSIPAVCLLSFSQGGQGVEISARTQADCRHFCGYNAGFEGTYLSVQSGCRHHEIQQTRKGFEQLYNDKNYKPALAKLSPILEDCLATLEWEEEGSIRNDLAIAQYKNGLFGECLETLSQYAEDVKRDDDEISEKWTPALADRYLSIVKAARTNIDLCAKSN